MALEITYKILEQKDLKAVPCLKYLPAVYLEKEEVCVSSTHRRDIGKIASRKDGWCFRASVPAVQSHHASFTLMFAALEEESENKRPKQ